ncbi:MAG: hypothetical protein ACO1PM_08205 [Acidovorax sp.]
MNAAAAPSAHVCTAIHQRSSRVVVWHLVGPQGCGKGLFAAAAAQVITARRVSAVHLTADELVQEFSGNPERIAQYLNQPLVVLLETNLWEPGEHPRHWMRGDRLIDLTDYSATRDRRPGLDRLLVKAMLDHPCSSVNRLREEVKNQYSRLHRSMLDLSAIASQRPGGAA